MSMQTARAARPCGYLCAGWKRRRQRPRFVAQRRRRGDQCNSPGPDARFDYDMLLWGERQIRSVANMTRQDARDFLALARDTGLSPPVVPFPLQDANRALAAVKHETESAAAVIVL